MGTWISHLRTAEKIIDHLPGVDREWFYAGSIAPDCGMPDETWTNFDPPKFVTNYLAQGTVKYLICDLNFYSEYRERMHLDSSAPETSFLWGYYFHLLTDRLWVERIDPTTKAECATLIAEKGKSQVIDIIINDWYDLDHQFLRDHPGWQPWNTFLGLNFTHFPIQHISEDAINYQFNTIRQYYATSENDRVPDRPYPFLNGRTMQRIIDDASAASLKIFQMLQNHLDLHGLSSAVEMLDAEECAPYPPPLGDTV